MPRSLLAAAALSVAVLIAPVPNTLPMPDPAGQPQAIVDAAGAAAPSERPLAGRSDPAPAAANPPAPPPGVTIPASALPVAQSAEPPAPVVQDLNDFGRSQRWGTPVAIRAWITDLNGDGAPDALAQARYIAGPDGAEVLYHFAYFAEGAGYRRGSAMSLAQGIVEVAQDGQTLYLTVQKLRPGDSACCPSGQDVVRLRF